jgi:tetratricopeptide (TPR) repeat protein
MSFLQELRRRNVAPSLFASVVFMILIIGCSDKGESPQVQFSNSCKSAVQGKFNRAITLLHSFEYPETTRLFREITEEDPDCAMAYWGAAMSIWHPLWAPPSESDLEKGAALLSIATDLESTPRESNYIDALSVFFSSNDITSHRDRAGDYESRMSDLYSDNLQDPEAAMFYSLSLLASADPRDKSYANQFKSAGLLNWVRASQPTHPGVLHYLIHSYDYPGLAHLALDAALTYADAAPDSAHAQHMPSHIFTRLGLWDRSLSSNHDSTRSAAEYTASAHLSGHYDEGLHSIDYLMYAMLQTGRDDEAQQLLMRLGKIKKTNTENFKVAFTYASSPARYALERRMWNEASDLQFVREDFAWDDFPWAQSIHYFARGIGSARNGQPEKARQELVIIEDLLSNLPQATPAYFQTEVEVHAESVKSWILLAEGDEKGALSLAAAAADREDAVDKHPVTPGEVLPARELYADMLLEVGNHAQSLEQYQAVLEGSPNRLNALIGAAQAAALLGETKLAEQYRSVLLEQTRSANGRRASLDSMMESNQ